MNETKFRQIIQEELRNVIKQELSEILKQGLSSTINELNNNANSQVVNERKQIPVNNKKKSNVKFNKNKFSSILNNTDKLQETRPESLNSYADLMSENIVMTSNDAMNFGVARKNMANSIHPSITAPDTMTDPETGKEMSVDPTIAAAMTRDYSALMRAMDNKKKNK